MHVKRIALLVLCLTLALSLVFVAPAHKVNATDGTTGTIQFGFSEYIGGNSYVFILNDLTAECAYALTFTASSSTNLTFTTGVDETTMSKRVVMAEPSAGTETIVALRQGLNATGTVIDQVRLQMVAVTQIINSDSIMDIVTALIPIIFLVGVFVTIFVVIKRKAAK